LQSSSEETRGKEQDATGGRVKKSQKKHEKLFKSWKWPSSAQTERTGMSLKIGVYEGGEVAAGNRGHRGGIQDKRLAIPKNERCTHNGPRQQKESNAGGSVGRLVR